MTNVPNARNQIRREKIKLSIVIVYYKEFTNLLKLLKSIKTKKPNFLYEIILVDNSKDINAQNLSKKFRNIKYVKSSGNIGYAKGNNLGAKYAKGKYLLIINPDTKLKRNSIAALVSFLENHKDTGVVAPNLVYDTGEFLENIGSRELTPIRAIFALSILNRIFPNNPISWNYFLKDIPKNVLREVDTVPGTAFMIRKSVFDKIHGFDKNFFLYFEEFDLCKRVKEFEYKIFINPKAEVVHDWKPGDGGVKLKKYFEASRFYYFKKHYGLFSAVVVEFSARISKKNAVTLFLIIIIVIVMLKLI